MKDEDYMRSSSHRWGRWLLLPVWIALLAAGASAEEIDFFRDIRPIFESRCYKCHGPEKQKNDLRLDRKPAALAGGASGPAIAPGQSSQSRLIKLVESTDPDERMPLNADPLRPEEIARLRAWIDQGARWPEEPAVADPTEKHWAFQPIADPKPPALENDSWARNAIDRFILARLRQAGLEPSSGADKITLLRRAHFVLIGLAPTPEEVKAFLSDSSREGFERVIEKLLASPRFGERWARHWLDVVRFAESNGFETNTPRPKAWPYRDYVIRAFNEDKPYDRFIQEQLAGDVLHEDEATGFIVGGPWDEVKSPDVNLTAQQRMDELHDMVATTGSAFLGLTVGCARCHNHKFDPIPQRDYYAMQAIFAGVKHGERVLKGADYQERMDKAEKLRASLAGLEKELATFERKADPSAAEVGSPLVVNARENVEEFPPITVRFIRMTFFASIGMAEPCVDEFEVYGEEMEDGRPRNLALATKGAKAAASSVFPNSELHTLKGLNDGKTGNGFSWISSEAGRGWVEIELPAPAKISRIVWSRDRTGVYTDRLATNYVIEGALTRQVWTRLAGRKSLRPVVNPRFNIERFQPVKARKLKFAISKTSSLEPCLDELEVFTSSETPENIALAAKGAKASSSGNYPNSDLHKLEHINDGKYGNGRSWISSEEGRGWVTIEFPGVLEIDRVEWARDREEKFTDRLPVEYQIEVETEDGAWRPVAGSNDREPFSPWPKALAVFATDQHNEQERERLSELLKERETAREKIKGLTSFTRVYAGVFEQPGPTYRLHRGEPLQKREEITPGALTKISSELTLPADAPEPERRMRLARWIAHRSNPLTARVMVNRIWQGYFGEGLVETPSDFGLNGAKPTHPELLDWLATRLIENGWSLKSIHKLIATSSSFRQASFPRNDALRVDAKSRLLWRFPARRLEAEILRDNILWACGNLDLTMGGPGFDLFEPNSNYVRVFNPKTAFGPPEWRRMIYLTKHRMQLDDTFGAFDCPDAGQIAPKRTISITPLQALSLLNSPFMMEQARILSERLKRGEASDSSSNRGEQADAAIELAYQLCFSRQPKPVELAAGRDFIAQHGLQSFCRALLNANEFAFIF